MRICTWAPLYLPPVFHGDPQKGRPLLTGRTWSHAQCHWYNRGLNKYVLNKWNLICQTILCGAEDSYQVSVPLKLVSYSLKYNFYCFWFFTCRDNVQYLFFCQALWLELMERMIRKDTVLALRWWTDAWEWYSHGMV